MSDTPRSDKVVYDPAGSFVEQSVVPSSFARQLERELNEAKKAIKEAYELIWANLDEDSQNASEILSKTIEAEQL